MRIKLFNGSIPGFTDAEIAQRQAQISLLQSEITGSKSEINSIIRQDRELDIITNYLINKNTFYNSSIII